METSCKSSGCAAGLLWLFMPQSFAIADLRRGSRIEYWPLLSDFPLHDSLQKGIPDHFPVSQPPANTDRRCHRHSRKPIPAVTNTSPTPIFFPTILFSSKNAPQAHAPCTNPHTGDFQSRPLRLESLWLIRLMMETAPTPPTFLDVPAASPSQRDSRPHTPGSNSSSAASSFPSSSPFS